MSNTFTAQELADFYQKVADGGEIDYTLMPKDCFGHPENGPHMGCSKDMWRIKPTKKVIDLSVLIDSQIDCEFDDRGNTSAIAKLETITTSHTGEPYYINDKGLYWGRCTPRMNHKHAWQGGECPLPEGFIVRLTKWSVHVPHISHIELTTKQWISSKANEHTTVQAFEVLGVADGYVMPWEQDND